MERVARRVLRRVRDLRIRVGSFRAREYPDGIVKHVGVGNRRNDTHYYASLEHFRQSVPWIAPPDSYDFLLCQSFVTDEFVASRKPKVFFTKEPPQLMDVESLRLISSEGLKQFAYRYDEPAVDQRMFFPSLPGRMGLVVRRLENNLAERRENLCCIINRYSEDTALELVSERTRFVEAMDGDIDIFGRDPWVGSNGWNRYPTYKGAARNKLETMRRYTFAIVFENTDQPGYISEKIVDALCAGTVPLYWGGGDFLEESVPRSCFIDCRHSDPEETRDHIKQLSHESVVAYRQAGLRFLRSPAAARFTWSYFADAVIQRFRTQFMHTSEQ